MYIKIITFQMRAFSKLANALPSKNILRFENYAFKTLTPAHAKETVDLFANQFTEQQPLSNAFYRLFPLQKHKKVQKWSQFWYTFAPDFTTNQVSVGCFDMDKQGQLVGAVVGKDLNYVPEGFQEKYMKTRNFMSSIIRIQQHLLSLVSEQYQPLLKKTGVVMDLWGGAMKKGFMGKQLFHKLIMANEYFGTIKGYQYAFGYTSNYKSEIALGKLNYQKISTCNATQFQLDGVRLFEKIQETHKFPALFLKELKNVETKMLINDLQ